VLDAAVQLVAYAVIQVQFFVVVSQMRRHKKIVIFSLLFFLMEAQPPPETTASQSWRRKEAEGDQGIVALSCLPISQWSISSSLL
jgi:hypothetical protein